MGLLDKLSGNAVEVAADDVARELAPLLAGGENVEHAFKVVQDMFVFTNKRLMTIDKQGATGKKVDYRSIPYRSISQSRRSRPASSTSTPSSRSGSGRTRSR